jgi:hypothetical protein
MPSPVTDRKRGKATRSGAWPHSPGAIAATIAANERGVAPSWSQSTSPSLADLLVNVKTLTPGLLVQRLRADHRFAVITPEEDAILTAAGVEQGMPAGWAPGDDPWARYRHARLDPITFGPLPADVAVTAARLSTPGG